MKKRDREQLRASIARDLVQGQGERSPTRELLRQYAPLAGVVTTPNLPPQPGGGVLSLWKTPWQHMPRWHRMRIHHGTVLRWQETPPWHDMPLSMVKLRVPNTLNYSVFPTLNPFAKAVYYQLFLLSHGFQRDRCIVGLV